MGCTQCNEQSKSEDNVTFVTTINRQKVRTVQDQENLRETDEKDENYVKYGITTLAIPAFSTIEDENLNLSPRPALKSSYSNIDISPESGD